MCFSAEASFASGALLVPAGVYCVWSASVKKPAYLALAAVPLIFGVQQISEGFVWRAVEADDAGRVQAASLVFLFFALAFWPFWFPLVATLIETQPARRWAFASLTAVAVGWFWILYFPLLREPGTRLTTQIVQHSIRYDYPDLLVYRYVARPVLRVLYLLSVAVPMVFARVNLGWAPAAVLGASALIAVLLFEHAFVSVWCFFAAVMAVYCCVVFYRLPQPRPRESVGRTDEPNATHAGAGV